MTDYKDIINKLIELRGITDPDDIEEYLSQRPRKTYDPFLLKNMQEGVDLILEEIGKGSRICIYGDYDVDGVTSVCILHTVLSHLTDKLTWYIPSRFTEGYGLHRQAIDRLHDDGVDLIITVDCGITSNDEVAYAQSLGMRMLVTDHHSIGDELPGCICIDPKQEGETYPFRDLAGCGVAYKLLQAIQRQAGLPRSITNETLDLVATGTVADIVPLKDENRTIVKYGLHKINERSRTSLSRLVDAISYRTISSEGISFGIAPHINAAGRIDHAAEAVKLLLADNDDIHTIDRQVRQLISFNAKRKQLQEAAYQKCLAAVDPEDPILCLRVEGIHEGIAGITAGKIKELYQLPIILATPVEPGILKGTGRSIPGVDLFELLDGHRDLFIRVGGHAKACGFTISEEGYAALKPMLLAEAAALYEADPALRQARGEYDLELSPADVTVDLVKALRVLEPFGEGNELPRFLLRDIRPLHPAYMGEGKHARFTAADRGAYLECVLFQKAKEYSDKIWGQDPVSVIGTLKTNTWNGKTKAQMVVEEIL